MIAANATDGLLDPAKYKILADDRRAFPPYEATIVVRDESLKLYPGMKEALNELSGKINEETMRKMNYAVDQTHAAVTDVAANFLRQAGLQ